MHVVTIKGGNARGGRQPVVRGELIEIVHPGDSNVNTGNVLFVVEPRDNLFPVERGAVYVFDPELSVVFRLSPRATYTVVRPTRVVIDIHSEEF